MPEPTWMRECVCIHGDWTTRFLVYLPESFARVGRSFTMHDLSCEIMHVRAEKKLSTDLPLKSYFFPVA